MIDLYKKIEMEFRSKNNLSLEILSELSTLSEWQYRNALNFLNHLKRKIKMEDSDQTEFSFLYKFYEQREKPIIPLIEQQNLDLLIVGLKRTQKDTLLTDPYYELVIPADLKYRIDQIWGFNVVDARTLAVEHAIREGFKYLLFIDDDILVPRNALQKLWNLMKDTNKILVAADYYKKIEPLESAHTSNRKPINLIDKDIVEVKDVVALGFALINIERLIKEVSPPYFMEFRNLENMITLSEDAFFTQKIVEEANDIPLVDKTIKTLHVDKIWKRIYGEKDETVKYASGWLEDFEEIRKPPKLPLILVGVPSRYKDIISTDLNKLLLLRGYISDYCRVEGLPVDEARNKIVEEALKKDAEYVLFIDDDVVLEKGAAIKMLATDKDIVVADYPLKQLPLTSAHLTLNKDGRVLERDLIEFKSKDDLQEINWLIGLGAALIKTKVFKQIRKPWFKTMGVDPHTKEWVHEDAFFTERVITNGFQIYLHTKIKTVHLDFQEKKAYSKYDPYSEVFASFPWIKEFNWEHELP